jgi:hypothetical protein
MLVGLYKRHSKVPKVNLRAGNEEATLCAPVLYAKLLLRREAQILSVRSQ